MMERLAKGKTVRVTFDPRFAQGFLAWHVLGGGLLALLELPAGSRPGMILLPLWACLAVPVEQNMSLFRPELLWQVPLASAAFAAACSAPAVEAPKPPASLQEAAKASLAVIDGTPPNEARDILPCSARRRRCGRRRLQAAGAAGFVRNQAAADQQHG